MAILAGTTAALPGLEVTGTLSGAAPGSVAWVPQHPEFLKDTVEQELALYAGLPVGHPALADGLASVGGQGLLGRRTGELSPGEARRVAVARALLRTRNQPGVGLLLLDEPTAHVDAASTEAIRAVLRGLRGERHGAADRPRRGDRSTRRRRCRPGRTRCRGRRFGRQRVRCRRDTRHRRCRFRTSWPFGLRQDGRRRSGPGGRRASGTRRSGRRRSGQRRSGQRRSGQRTPVHPGPPPVCGPS
jgi:hypothetical protein